MNLFDLACIQEMQKIITDFFANLECTPNFRTPFKE